MPSESIGVIWSILDISATISHHAQAAVAPCTIILILKRHFNS